MARASTLRLRASIRLLAQNRSKEFAWLKRRRAKRCANGGASLARLLSINRTASTRRAALNKRKIECQAWRDLDANARARAFYDVSGARESDDTLGEAAGGPSSQWAPPGEVRARAHTS